MSPRTPSDTTTPVQESRPHTCLPARQPLVLELPEQLRGGRRTLGGPSPPCCCPAAAPSCCHPAAAAAPGIDAQQGAVCLAKHLGHSRQVVSSTAAERTGRGSVYGVRVR